MATNVHSIVFDLVARDGGEPMGTVGLSFGSATSGDGFDVASTVTQILAISQAVETPWKTQLTALTAQDAVFTTLGTDLSTLSTALQSLTDFEGVMAEKLGSSSDTNTLSLTSAAATASAGSHSVTVTQLAQTSSVYTDEVANASDTLAGSITIQVGASGTTHTITVGSNSVTIQSGTDDPVTTTGTGSDTLASLAAAINLAGIGVQASLIKDNGGTRLSLVSATSGSAGELTVTSALTDATTSTSSKTVALGSHVGMEAQDAKLSVDGIDMVSSSNTLSTAIPGVTFQLLATSSTPVQVQITNDVADVSTAMNAFVTAYNAVVADMKTQEGKTSTGDAEPLYGSPTLSLLQSQLSQGLLGGKASGAISSVTQLGVTVNQDGTLTYSASDMESELNTNYSDVVGFFQNTGSFGLTFTKVLDGLGSSSTTGAIYLAQQENAAQETALNADIDKEEALLATQKTTLTAELNSANEILQAIPEQLNEVDEMYSAITGYNTGS